MNARAPLNVIGLEDSWENVHPDVIHLPQPFAGYPYWMVFTPYPQMNDRVENPTIRASQDGMRWQIIPGMSDPLVPPPGDPEMHHADPELIYSQGRLHVVYLTIRRKSADVTFNVISCGGDLRWSSPTAIREDVGAVSPTFQFDGDVLRAWFIRMNPKDTSRSELVQLYGSDLHTLGNERICHLSIPGHVPWHVDVLKVKDGYEALVTAFPLGTDNSQSRLFHLTSKDGLAFEPARDGPVVEPTSFGWDDMVIHRSCFLKEPDGTYRIWYSGGSWGYHFGIGLLQGPMDSLRSPDVALAPVPPYFVRFPRELYGRLRYKARRTRQSSS
jgi:hypothetical protein